MKYYIYSKSIFLCFIFYSRYYIMYFLPNRAFIFYILLISRSDIVLAHWQLIKNDVVAFPPHFYQIKLNQNQTLRAVLTWDQGGDLDIYLYKEGSNILDDNCIYKSTSNRLNIEQLLYKSNNESMYFVRVYPYRLRINQVVQYKISFDINSGPTTYSGTFYEKYPDKIVTSIANTQQFFDIAFRYEASSDMVDTLFINFENNSYSLSMNKLNTVCRNSQSSPDYFILVIGNSIREIYYLTNFNFSFYRFIAYTPCPKQCEINYVWNDTGQFCEKATTVQPINSMKNQAIIITISVFVPILLAIIIFIVIMRLIRKCKRKRNRNAVVNLKINETEGDMKIQDDCSICLGGNCNATLRCSHQFHKKCIQEWLKKSRYCPLCRTSV